KSPATKERRWLAIALTGARDEPGWSSSRDRVDAYDAKGFAEHALEALGLRAGSGDGGALGGFEPDCHATLTGEDGVILGEFGEGVASLREQLGIPAPVFAAVVSLDVAPAVPAAPLRYPAPPPVPGGERGPAFLLGDG